MNEERNKQDRAKAIDDTKQPKFDALSNYFQEVLVLLKHFFDFEFPPFDDLGSTKDWDAFKKRLKLSIREDRQDKADLQENINNYKQLLDSKCIELERLQEKLTGATAPKGFFDKEANLSDILAGEKGLVGGSLMNDVSPPHPRATSSTTIKQKRCRKETLC